jgi:ATP-dependent DNA helicase 2 subunit 2
MIERPASWKKLSAISLALAGTGSMAVKMERSHHLNDEDETEVEMENVAKGRSGGYGKISFQFSPVQDTGMARVSFPYLRLMRRQ